MIDKPVSYENGKLNIFCTDYQVKFNGKPVNFRSGDKIPSDVDEIEVECDWLGSRILYTARIGRVSINVPGLQNDKLTDYVDPRLIKNDNP